MTKKNNHSHNKVTGVLEASIVEQEPEGVAVCADNMTSPVVDTAYYIDDIHYKIGNRKYIEGAPHDVSPRTGLP
jgi:hypothetical protein